MSSRRTRAPNITENELNDLLSRLQALIPELDHNNETRVSISRVLKETCDHIRSLQKEVKDLSDRLSDLLENMDPRSAQAGIIRSLIM
ncbi:hypothetical protein MRB53_034350 [Persea americana]|uniref:Uncharacterized protein n=1 Tax=Persea americana TaxID=3435 RepID=A0ACC2KXT0_PERAE|nr:hypothetical protein MRB53_034350 [Persea americana]